MSAPGKRWISPTERRRAASSYGWRCPRARRGYLNARFRCGRLVELRVLTEREGSTTKADVWIGIGVTASGETVELAIDRCWRRWNALDAETQTRMLEQATLQARARGMI